MSSLRPLLVVLLVLGAAVAVLPTASTAQDAYFGVTNVTVTPTTPAPGDTVEASVTIENFAKSSLPIDVTDVAVRTGFGQPFEELNRVENVGSLAPGSSLTIPVPLTFGSAGVRTLRVYVYADVNGTIQHITYPVTIRVRDEHPSLTLHDRTYAANATSPITFTVSNGLGATVRDVSVTLSGPDATENRSAHVASLAAGASAPVAMTVRPAAVGQRSLDVHLDYTTDGNVRRSVDRTFQVTAEPLDTAVALDLARVGGGSTVAATVSNLGNVRATKVVVTGTVGGRTVARSIVGTLAPDAAATVRLNATDLVGDANMTVAVTYDAADSAHRIEGSTAIAGNPATIELTGLDVEVTNGQYHVTGTASNVGLDPASSVVVRVMRGPGVEPAYPGRSYFVGSVPASDFASFDVYADVSGNATGIPLQVTYLRNGVTQTAVVTVPIDAAGGSSGPNQPAPAGGTDYLAIGLGLLVAIVVVAVIYVGWRNYRGRP